MTVSEGRDLLIRQIAEQGGYWWTLAEGRAAAEWWISLMERLGFEVIPASTLEADRRVLDAADEDVAAADAVDYEVEMFGRVLLATSKRRSNARVALREAVRARRGVSGD